MFQFGIVRRDQISRNFADGRGHRFPHPAITLLEDLDGKLTEAEEELIDCIYQSIPGGVQNTKYTRRHRYRPIDEIVVDQMKRRFPAEKHLKVHDAAVSSGITSLEWFELLTRWKDVSFLATDYYDTAVVVSFPNSGWQVVFDSERRPAQFIGTHFVISAFMPEKKRYPVNRLLQRMLKSTILPRALAVLDADDAVKKRFVREIRLFHPKCVAAALRDSRFSLGRYDILESADTAYDVVRLMGVVGDFPKELLRPMLCKLGESVGEGGLFVQGRREADIIATTIFERSGRCLIPVRDIMGGSPVRDIVVGLDLSPAPGPATGEPAT